MNLSTSCLHTYNQLIEKLDLQKKEHYEYKFFQGDTLFIEDFLNFLDETLDKQKVSIGITFGDYNHCFYLYREKDKEYVIDSYLGWRYPSVRPFSITSLQKFLEDMDISSWNLLCKSSHFNRELKQSQVTLEIITLE